MFTKTSTQPALAEALFGSAARGDTDSLSDRDILIVDDDVELLAARSAELESQGASVASYTFAKLIALASRGALFIQHLKLEARVTRDVSGRLRKILGEFSPRKDYSAEITDNAAMSALAGIIPAGTRGILFAADILFVGVRNHGVLSLAERGVHVYGFETVLAALESEGIVDHGAARALRTLRFLKCLYRRGEASYGNTVLDAVETALKVLPSAFFPTQIHALDPKCIISLPLPTSNAAYLILRDLERRYVALQTLGIDPALHVEFGQLARWINNPRAYASLSQQLAPCIQARMKQLTHRCIQIKSANVG